MIRTKRNENHTDAIDSILFVWMRCERLDPYGLAGGRSHFRCHKNEIYDRTRMQLHNLCDDETNKQAAPANLTKAHTS